MHSEYFRDLLPVSIKNLTETQEDETPGSYVNPIILDFHNDDFETFLSIIYPS